MNKQSARGNVLYTRKTTYPTGVPFLTLAPATVSFLIALQHHQRDKNFEDLGNKQLPVGGSQGGTCSWASHLLKWTFIFADVQFPFSSMEHYQLSVDLPTAAWSAPRRKEFFPPVLAKRSKAACSSPLPPKWTQHTSSIKWISNN
jgi:hypothetical protein